MRELEVIEIASVAGGAEVCYDWSNVEGGSQSTEESPIGLYTGLGGQKSTTNTPRG